MPTLDDVLPQLSNVMVFSTTDISPAFYHLKLDEESSYLMTFETPFGNGELNLVPELFQSLIHAALARLKGIHCIADDILITGSRDSLEEAQRDHDRNLLALLQRYRQKGLKLNRKKLRLNRSSLIYMGHELTVEGLRPSKQLKLKLLK